MANITKLDSTGVRKMRAEVYAATSLLMEEVSLYNRANLNARREFRLIEEHQANGTIPSHLESLRDRRTFKDWLDFNGLGCPEDWSSDSGDNVDCIMDKLRSEYQEDISRTSSGLVDFKQKARRFLKESVPEQADKSLRLFDVYCKAVDKKATLKPSRRRWSKTRSLWEILRMSLPAVI